MCAVVHVGFGHILCMAGGDAKFLLRLTFTNELCAHCQNKMEGAMEVSVWTRVSVNVKRPTSGGVYGILWRTHERMRMGVRGTVRRSQSDNDAGGLVPTRCRYVLGIDFKFIRVASCRFLLTKLPQKKFNSPNDFFLWL